MDGAGAGTLPERAADISAFLPEIRVAKGGRRLIFTPLALDDQHKRDNCHKIRNHIEKLRRDAKFKSKEIELRVL